jgi:dihydrofolate synthase/folylpolyglutamate synthase
MDDQALNYRETIDWLFNLQFFGIKLGLENIQSLAAQWGNPERRYPVIHVAGSNGKGSTSCFIAAALQAAGYRTGLYTSPHLVDFSERIRVNGQPISESDVVDYACRLRPHVEELSATFFEATTLMAFQHFADRDVDVAVIETGLGGRLDATNIVMPDLTVITSLSVEHSEHLGNSIEEIAYEKGGIVKEGVPLVTAVRQPDARVVLHQRCIEMHSPIDVLEHAGSILAMDDIDGMSCAIPELDAPVDVGLIGMHQVENARLAIRALRALHLRFPLLNDVTIRKGLREVVFWTGLRGRMERLQDHPELVIDVGHNADGIDAMLRTWSAVREMQYTDLVFGVLKSKDIFGMFSVLKHYPARSLTLVEAASHEARPLEEMRQAANDADLDVYTEVSIIEGVRARLKTADHGAVLIFGSHYVVGDFLRHWIRH